MPEVGCLGQGLDVREVGRRLQGDRRQRFQAMQPARGVNVADRDREQKPPAQIVEPAPEPVQPPQRPPPDGVVALVDQGQQRVKLGLGPGLGGRCDQDKWMR
jgi:hypothetical protein